jgi:hypothetical protein
LRALEPIGSARVDGDGSGQGAGARLAAEPAENRSRLAADQAIDQQTGASELAQLAGDQRRLIEAALPQAAAVERHGDGQPFAFKLR